jgi:S-layer homology domain
LTKKIFISFVLLLFIVSGVFADLKIANDPSTVGTGARSLGMGGIMLNFTDVSSIFGNPASLNDIKDNQYTMMAGRFINEVDYLSIGSAISTQWGTIGVAFLNSQLSYTGPAITTEVVDGIRVLPSTTEVATDIYRNSAFYLSYAKPAKELLNFSYLENVVLGGTFKIFSQELNAANLNGTAQGYEMDLGAQYLINPWAKFSILGKNVLPAAMGGKLVWQPTGREESYPYYVKSGFKVDLGGEETPLYLGDNSVALAIEYDFHPRENAPNLMHYGIEWGLGEILDVRIGQDQGYLGSGGTSVFDVANNLTYGVGVTFKGWRFDYAFHEYYDDSSNNTSYFSLTYGLPYLAEKPEVKRISLNPKDKSVVDKAVVEITGEIIDPKIANIFIRDRFLEVEDGKIVGKVDLKLGKNSLLISGTGFNREEIFAKKWRILRLVGFKDVPENYWAKNAIEELATLGLIKGYPNDIFKPEKGITRAEFATLLARIAGQDKYQGVQALTFKDLPKKHWSYPSVDYAVAAGLMKGYPNGTFEPNKKISRAEGVVVIARFAGLNLSSQVNEVPYKDVPGRHWAIYGVNAAKEAGLLKHLGDKFEPKKDMSRAETAEILSNVVFIKKRVSELLDFNRGY